MATLNLSTIDRLSKKTSMHVPVEDAYTPAEMTALSTAIDAIILGSTLRAAVTTEDVEAAGSAVPPADNDANRGNKWLFRTQRSDGAIATNEIGTADNAALASATSDYVDLTAGAGLAVANAWNAAYNDNGVTGTLLSVQQVSRKD